MNEEVYQRTNESTNRLTDMIRKCRLILNGHKQRMNKKRLTKRILNVVNSSKKKTNSYHEIEDDLRLAGINRKEREERGKFRVN